MHFKRVIYIPGASLRNPDLQASSLPMHFHESGELYLAQMLEHVGIYLIEISLRSL